MGGALCIAGCRCVAWGPCGLITISAGLPLAPPSWRRRCPKLIDGAGSACEAGVVWTNAGFSAGAAGIGGGCWAALISVLGLECRVPDDPEWFCGAADGPAAVERRRSAAACCKFGLRPPARAGAALLGGCCRSSDDCGALTTFTEGGTVDTMDAVLPRLCSISSFCFCFTVSIERTCSSAAGSSRMIVKPITTGEMLLMLSDAEFLTSVLMGCEMPLIVTRRRFDAEGRASGGINPPVWSLASCDVRARAGSEVLVGRGSLSASSLMRTVRGDRCESDSARPSLPSAGEVSACGRFR